MTKSNRTAEANLLASLSDIAALTREATDELEAITNAALSVLDTDAQAVLTVGQLLIAIRNRVQVLGEDIANTCEHHDCGFTSQALDEVRAKIDARQKGAAA